MARMLPGIGDRDLFIEDFQRRNPVDFDPATGKAGPTAAQIAYGQGPKQFVKPEPTPFIPTPMPSEPSSPVVPAPTSPAPIVVEDSNDTTNVTTETAHDISGTKFGDALESGIGAIVNPITGAIDTAANWIGEGITELKSTPKGNETLNEVIDTVTGLPFGIASTLVNPTIIEDTPWGDEFNAGGGGIIGAAGKASYLNLEDLYHKDTGGLNYEGVAVGQEGAEYSIAKDDQGFHYGGDVFETFDEAEAAQTQDQEATDFYAPSDAPEGLIKSPVAVHEGIIPGTTVVSGMTDLLPEEAQVGPQETKTYLDTIVEATTPTQWEDTSTPGIQKSHTTGLGSTYRVGNQEFDNWEDAFRTNKAEQSGYGYDVNTDKYTYDGKEFSGTWAADQYKKSIGDTSTTHYVENGKYAYNGEIYDDYKDASGVKKAFENEGIEYDTETDKYSANDKQFNQAYEAENYQKSISDTSKVYGVGDGNYSFNGKIYDNFYDAYSQMKRDTEGVSLNYIGGDTYDKTNPWKSSDGNVHATKAAAEREHSIDTQNRGTANSTIFEYNDKTNQFSYKDEGGKTVTGSLSSVQDTRFDEINTQIAKGKGLLYDTSKNQFVSKDGSFHVNAGNATAANLNYEQLSSTQKKAADAAIKEIQVQQKRQEQDKAQARATSKGRSAYDTAIAQGKSHGQAMYAAQQAARSVVVGHTSSGEEVRGNVHGGSVVTDSSGNPVTSINHDGSRSAVTSGGNWNR